MLHRQHFSLSLENGSAIWMAGPGAPLSEIAKYLGRLQWTAVGNDRRTFTKGEVKVHVWDDDRPATNGVAINGSKGTDIVLALSSFATSLPFFHKLALATNGKPTVVLAPVNQTLYELKGFRITKLEVVVTPGTSTAKDIEEARASARMLGACLDEIGKFALKYYVGRLVPGDRTFEGQKGYGRKLIEETTGKLIPDFKEGFEKIVDGISEALMSNYGTAIHSKITYETEQRFLNAIPYWSQCVSFATLRSDDLPHNIWTFKSTQEAVDKADRWKDAYYDALVEQLDQILPYE